LNKLEEAREASLSLKSVNCEGFFKSEMIVEAKREGLNSDLKAKERTKRAPRGTEDLEAFLSAVEKQIMDKIFDKGNGYRPNLKSEYVKMVNKNLKLTSTVIISTDKTNLFRFQVHPYMSTKTGRPSTS
jgi:hypothetical protein